MTALVPISHPTITVAERDAIVAPETGHTIWNLTASELQTWNGTSWVSSSPPIGTQPRIGVTKVQSIVAGVPLTVGFAAELTLVDDVKIRDNAGGVIDLNVNFGGTTVTVQSNVSLTNIQITAEGPPA